MEKVPWLLDAHKGKFEKLWKAVLRKYRPSDHTKEPTEAPPGDAIPAVNLPDGAMPEGGIKHGEQGVAGFSWTVPEARVPNPTHQKLEEYIMRKGGRSFTWRPNKRTGSTLHFVVKKKPVTTQIKVNETVGTR